MALENICKYFWIIIGIMILDSCLVIPAYLRKDHIVHNKDFEAGHQYGQVQIKVYRGPTNTHYKHHFAPHGYWVKQPADDHHHK